WLPGEADELPDGQRADRLAHAFLDAQARVADAAERRQLGAKAGNLVDVDRAAAQLARAAQRELELARDHARRQAVGRRLGELDRLIRVAHPQDRRDRSERLARDDVHLGPDVVEHAWLDHGPPAIAAREQPRTRGDGSLHTLG